MVVEMVYEANNATLAQSKWEVLGMQPLYSAIQGALSSPQLNSQDVPQDRQTELVWL